MVIKVLNLEKCIKKFDQMGQININPAITNATIMVQRRAKDLVAVDTGDLMRSIHRKTYPDKKYGVVYTALEYAMYQEFGTRKMNAHPYLMPAMVQEGPGIYKMMQRFVLDKLAQISKQ